MSVLLYLNFQTKIQVVSAHNIWFKIRKFKLQKYFEPVQVGAGTPKFIQILS